MRVRPPRRTEQLRVQLADTDAAQVLYYAAPFRWAEGMFSRWLAESGNSISQALAAGVGFLTVSATVEHRVPLGLDDLVHCSLRVSAIGRRSVDLHYEFSRLGCTGPAVEVRVRHVYSSVRPGVVVEQLPAWFRELCARPIGGADLCALGF
jgi:acyl-CoA thioester hydrolase